MKGRRGFVHFCQQTRGKEFDSPAFFSLLFFFPSLNHILLYNPGRAEISLSGNLLTIHLLIALSFVVLILLVVVLWSRNLKKAIEKKTRDLSESEAKFRQIFETSAVGISITDEGGKFISANPAMLNMLGYTMDEFTQFSIQEISHPDDLEKNMSFLRDLWAGKVEFFSLEKRTRHKDGHYIWGLLVNSLVRDSEGKPLFALAMFEDISERKESEKAQDTIYRITQAISISKNLDELFASIQATLGDLIPVDNFYFSLADPSDGLLHFPFFKDQFETSADPIPPGRSLTGYLMRKGTPLLLSDTDFDRLLAEGQVELIGHKPFSWLGAPLLIDDQVIGAMVAQSYSPDVRYSQHDADLFTFVSTQVAQAIEKKETEQALLRSDADMHALFAAMTDLVLVLDSDGNYIKVAGKTTDVLARNPTDLVGKNVHDVLEKKTADAFVNKIKQTLSSFKKQSYEYSIPIKNKLLWFTASISPIDANSVIWVAHEITDRKVTEEALKLNEARYHNLFEESPVSLWEEDFSAVKLYLDDLKKKGVDDFYRYFQQNPQSVHECISRIKIIDINVASLKLFHANTKEELLRHIEHIMNPSPESSIVEELVDIARGYREFNLEGWNRTIDDEPIFVRIKWSVSPGYEETLSKVIIVAEDITTRKEADEKINFRSRFEEVLMKISTRFINFPVSEIDGDIEGALRSVGELANTDFAGIFLIDQEKMTGSISYEWYKDGFVPSSVKPQDIAFSSLPWQNGQETSLPLINGKTSDFIPLDYYEHLVPNPDEIKYTAIFPMWANQKLIGIIHLIRGRNGQDWDQDSIIMLQQFANIISNALERTRLIDELKENAIHDELTGVLNRRGFLESAKVELIRAARYEHPTGMILFDIDELKSINDSWGHNAGDVIITEVVKCALKHVRKADLIARWGGDEFVILLPETNAASALQTANRLCQDINKNPIDLYGHSNFITVSVGVASTEKDVCSIDVLFSQADLALYAAKQAGKNRVHCARDNLPIQPSS